MRADVARNYLGWSFVAPVFHRGYWLVTSLYLVSVAELEPLQLVFIGTAQGIVSIAMEIPTGVLADTVSRKRSLVIGHVLMGSAMLTTGLVTAFPALVATQMLWGVAWTFWVGADVAWLSDELDAPERVDGVLARAARYTQLGSALGLIAFGALAAATTLATAIVASGAAMLGLGLAVALRFDERRFRPAPRDARLRTARDRVRHGFALARGDREIGLVLLATLLVNGAAEGFGRLEAKQLVTLGVPDAEAGILWLTALGLASLGVAAAALRIVEARIAGANAAPKLYAFACAAATVGLALFAFAPGAGVGLAAALVVNGIGWSVTRTVATIWVNRRAESEVRATLQSFLAQAEYAGEITLGFALGVCAQAAGLPTALAGSAALAAAAGWITLRARARGA